MAGRTGGVGSAEAVFFLIGLGAFPGEELEVLVEAGKIVEAALIAKLLDADAVVEEEFAGVADTDLGEELGVGLSGARLEIAAEGIGHQSCY